MSRCKLKYLKILCSIRWKSSVVLFTNLCEKGFSTPSAAKPADLISSQMFVRLSDLVHGIAQPCLAEQDPDSSTEMQGCPNRSFKWHLLLISRGNHYLFEEQFLDKWYIKMACKKKWFIERSLLTVLPKDLKR